MKYLSLFSGIGGFELGITQAYESKISLWDGQTGTSPPETIQQGLESAPESVLPIGNSTHNLGGGNSGSLSCIGFSEIDKYAVQIYQKHFPEHTNYGDITKINEQTLPDFDCLVGGFPCQAFSIAGKRMGFADTRGTLFFDIARILRQKQPRYLLLENVKGLLSHERGNTFTTIISTLDELGYDLQWQVLNSKNFGVPQNRERVFIVGHLRGTSRPQVFPIGSWGSECVGENAQGNDLAHTLSTSDKHRDNTGAVTASAYKEPPVVNGIRRLTPTECERLQGFPDGWTEGVSDTQRYKTLGNAVTVNVIEAIIKRLWITPLVNS